MSKNKDLYKLTEKKEKETLQAIEKNYQEVYDFIKKEIAFYSDVGTLNRTEIYKYKRYENLVRTIENELKNIDFLKQNELYNYVYDQYSLNYYYNGFIFETEYGKPLNYQMLPKNTIKASVENNLSKISLAENSFTVRSNVQKALTQSITLGLNINEAGDLIKKALETNANNVYRIYRTETTRASNKGRLDSIEHANKMGLNVKKQWFSTLDDRTRDNHGRLDGEIQDYDKPFSNGLMYPGDSIGNASEVINCRCAMQEILADYKSSNQYRVERGIDGKTKEIPYTTYDDWKKNRLEKKEPLVVNNKSINNIQNISQAKNIKELSAFIKKDWELEKIDIDGLDLKAVQGTFENMEKTFEEFPQLKEYIKEIKQSNDGIMSAVPIDTSFRGGVISFNTEHYKKLDNLKQTYKQALNIGHFPKGTSWDSPGSHELGHLLNSIIISKTKGNVFDKVQDWNGHITSKKIADIAIRKLKKEINYAKGTKSKWIKAEVSKYASTSDSELLAEAVSDYIANGKKANRLSVLIVDEINKRLKE